ncbi:MAG TPA: 30S ribosomal protein S8 [Leptospiraceae bacterium]|nr:30S ribosomal protein S8 [Leptospiraceae bacterium]HMY66273.1 30S ribosomal protein S8 [Leptospiraceae bacterium]HMZ58328.1 30S ribosomal protein S8 [Leptospiraceae bacterium]HNF12821.1 30S ribosomal protein S8 [Leptospiraceae bacterium]HNF27518.1 30S ribosomal protein S8 [Leptospiraceae bacterium]
MLTDPISDMLTRIRNAGRAKHNSCKVSGSRIKKSILDILKDEGFIKEYQEVKENNISNLEVFLKYDMKKKPVISQIDRNSRPGRRIYIKAEDVKPVRSNMGISILSTSKGVMTNKKAKTLKIGGEVICTVF